MHHGFRIFDVLWVAWLVIPMVQWLSAMRARRKAERLDTLAAGWPSVPAKIRGGSVRLHGGRWTLTLTYDAFESGHGIELWQHGFATKPEAEHARGVLKGQTCPVHYNPAHEQQTTLRWAEVQVLLAHTPYVPKLVPLGRRGYRWLIGLTGVAGAGLVTGLVVNGIAFAGSAACVCDAILFLLFAAPVVAIAALAPLTRMTIVAPRTGVPARLRWLFKDWQLAVLAVAVAAAVMSAVHFGPLFRALPMEADVPERVMAGTLGVVVIPVYLWALMISAAALRRLKPAPVETAVPTAA